MMSFLSIQQMIFIMLSASHSIANNHLAHLLKKATTQGKVFGVRDTKVFLSAGYDLTPAKKKGVASDDLPPFKSLSDIEKKELGPARVRQRWRCWNRRIQVNNSGHFAQKRPPRHRVRTMTPSTQLLLYSDCSIMEWRTQGPYLNPIAHAWQLLEGTWA